MSSGLIFSYNIKFHVFYSAGGKLTNKETGGPFKFVVKEGDQSYNQKHYEALGEVAMWFAA